MILYGNMVFADIIKVRSNWTVVGPKCSAWCPEKTETQTQTGEGHGRLRETHGGLYNDTETAVMWAAEHPGLLAPPEAREQNGTGTPVSGRNQPTDTLTLDFQPSEPRE